MLVFNGFYQIYQQIHYRTCLDTNSTDSCIMNANYQRTCFRNLGTGTFESGNSQCQALGGHLPVATKGAMMTFLASKFGTFWMSLRTDRYIFITLIELSYKNLKTIQEKIILSKFLHVSDIISKIVRYNNNIIFYINANINDISALQMSALDKRAFQLTSGTGFSTMDKPIHLPLVILELSKIWSLQVMLIKKELI